MKDVLRSAPRSFRAAVLMSTACTALHAPAGLEAINPALAGTTSTFATPGRHVDGPLDPATRDAPFHAEHANVRADRFEAFTSRLEPGRREIVYYALATTPGDFAAPAPRAEEM